MAGASEKKRASTAASTVQLYTQIIAGLYVAYFLLRVVYSWSSFTFGPLFVLLLFSVLNFVCLGMVQQALELGAPVTGPQDVLFINWLVQVLSIFWDSAWVCYLAIPAYLLYQYGGMIRSYFFPPKAVEAPISDADNKRQAKKERQAARAQKFQGR